MSAVNHWGKQSRYSPGLGEVHQSAKRGQIGKPAAYL